MRALALLLLLALAAPAWATDWYVCPDTQGEYGLEDGTSLANCFDGNADIAWASINPGDTLYLCGDWLPADARITVADSGTAENYITLSGLASPCGRASNSTISRAGLSGVSGQAITASNTAATRQYIRVEDLTIQDTSSFGFLWDYSTTGAVTDDTALWVRRVTFRNCSTTGTPQVCLRHTGQNFIVEDSVFEDCGNDCIWSRGANLRVSGNRFARVSALSDNGDAIQTDATGGPTDTGTYAIFNNVIDHSDKDVKQCVLVTARGVSTVYVHDNFCQCPARQTNADPFSSCHGYVFDVEATTGLRVERNFVNHGDVGIQVNANAAATFATRGRIAGNVVLNAYRWGILTDGYINNFDAVNNTVAGAGDTALDFRKNGTDNPDAIDIQAVNNVLVGSGLGMSYTQTPSPRGYNSYFDNASNIEANGSAGSTTTGDVTSDPMFAAGTGAWGADDDVCLTLGSPLLGAGTTLDAWATGHRNEDLGKPPAIGARGLCNGRRVVSSRRAVSERRAP